MIDFNPNDFSITVSGKKISMLPREYYLLKFLYHNKAQSFSREHLLNAVWGLEDPSERTVDDHIYRLRRKLSDFNHIVSIDTIRGLGYRLVLRETLQENPLLKEAEVTKNYTQLLERYWLFGHGEALELIAKNKKVLGLQISPSFSVYLSFLSGDFGQIISTEEVPFTEKAFYLLHIFRLIQFDMSKTLRLFEKAIESKKLPHHHLEEIQLNIISVYLEAGKVSQAEELIQVIKPKLSLDHSKGYTLFFYLDQILLNLTKRNWEAVVTVLQEIEILFSKYPYCREKGLYKIVKGLWFINSGSKPRGRFLISEGIGELQESRFVPHYIYGVHTILHLLRNFTEDKITRQKYVDIWNLLDKNYRFPELEEQIYHELTRYFF